LYSFLNDQDAKWYFFDDGLAEDFFNRLVGFLRQTNSFESVKSQYDDPKEAVDASRATAGFARIGAWSFAHTSGQTPVT